MKNLEGVSVDCTVCPFGPALPDPGLATLFPLRAPVEITCYFFLCPYRLEPLWLGSHLKQMKYSFYSLLLLYSNFTDGIESYRFQIVLSPFKVLFTIAKTSCVIYFR